MSGPRMPWKQDGERWLLNVVCDRQVQVVNDPIFRPERGWMGLIGWFPMLDEELRAQSFATADEAMAATERGLLEHAEYEVEQWTKVRDLLKSAGVGE